MECTKLSVPIAHYDAYGKSWVSSDEYLQLRAEYERLFSEHERLAGIAAFSSPDMVRWLTDQVMERDNVIDAMKSAGVEQIAKAFTENRWVPVSERLPEHDNYVLVFSKSLNDETGVVKEMGFWNYCDNQEPEPYFADDWGRDPNVTHWMPLPGPPEAKP